MTCPLGLRPSGSRTLKLNLATRVAQLTSVGAVELGILDTEHKTRLMELNLTRSTFDSLGISVV